MLGVPKPHCIPYGSPEETSLLNATLETEDTMPRLVYADWLDDRGEGKRAEYLRLDVALSTANLTDEIHDAGLKELRALRKSLDRIWVALVGRVWYPGG